MLEREHIFSPNLRRVKYERVNAGDNQTLIYERLNCTNRVQFAFFLAQHSGFLIETSQDIKLSIFK